MQIVETLAEAYAPLRPADIPSSVMAKARRVLLDFLGVLTAGSVEGSLSQVIRTYVERQGGAPEATILPTGAKVPATNAAFVMGFMAHSVELDDGHRFGGAHPAVAVIPAVLAFGERESRSFEEMLAAMVIGYDVMLRVARAISPFHVKRGFHATGTCGALGAATACAVLSGLGKREMGDAIALACLQSAGLTEMIHDEPQIKPLQPGKAAAAGVMAVDLVRLGARGPTTVFEGVHGWLKAMSDQYDAEALLGGMTERWEIVETYTKLYPTCRHCHAAIDLAVEAHDVLKAPLSDIRSVAVRMYDLGIDEVGTIYVPRTEQEAMFSLAFSVVTALKYGEVTLRTISATLNDPEVLSLSERLQIISDKGMNLLYPKERGASLEIQLMGERTFSQRVPLAKGEPERPAEDADLKRKLSALVSPYGGALMAERLWEICVESDLGAVHYRNIIDLFEESGVNEAAKNI